MRSILSWFKIALGDVFQLIGFGCVTGYNYYTALLVNTIIPIGILSLIALVYVRPNWWNWLTPTQYRGDRLRDLATKGAALFLVMVYSPISQKTFQIFACRQVGEHYYLSEDYSVQCYTGSWIGYAIYSSIIILIIPIGWPIVLFTYLYRRRHKLDDNGSTISHCRPPLTLTNCLLLLV
jgi:hypothetical protein